MAVEVSFCVDLGETCVDAAQLQAQFDEYRARLAAEFPHYGEVIMSSGDSQPIRVRDELAPAVQGLCFSAIPELLAGRTYVYTYFSASGRLVFIPSTIFVEVLGDQVPAVKFQRDELIPALYRRGQEYVALLQRLGGPDHEATAAELAKHAMAAKQALGN